jgi:hypothetical protein
VENELSPPFFQKKRERNTSIYKIGVKGGSSQGKKRIGSGLLVGGDRRKISRRASLSFSQRTRLLRLRLSIVHTKASIKKKKAERIEKKKRKNR